MQPRPTKRKAQNQNIQNIDPTPPKKPKIQSELIDLTQTDDFSSQEFILYDGQSSQNLLTQTHQPNLYYSHNNYGPFLFYPPDNQNQDTHYQFIPQSTCYQPIYGDLTSTNQIKTNTLEQNKKKTINLDELEYFLESRPNISLGELQQVLSSKFQNNISVLLEILNKEKGYPEYIINWNNNIKKIILYNYKGLNQKPSSHWVSNLRLILIELCKAKCFHTLNFIRSNTYSRHDIEFFEDSLKTAINKDKDCFIAAVEKYQKENNLNLPNQLEPSRNDLTNQQINKYYPPNNDVSSNHPETTSTLSLPSQLDLNFNNQDYPLFFEQNIISDINNQTSKDNEQIDDTYYFDFYSELGM